MKFGFAAQALPQLPPENIDCLLLVSTRVDPSDPARNSQKHPPQQLVSNLHGHAPYLHTTRNPTQIPYWSQIKGTTRLSCHPQN